MGVAPRDSGATQRRFMETIEETYDKARKLMRVGVPVEEAVKRSLTGDHMQVLFHLLCDHLTTTPRFGCDTLESVIADMRQQQTTPSTSSATESAHELQPQEAMPCTVTPDAATGSLASTGVTLDAEEYSLTGTGAGLQIQDAALSICAVQTSINVLADNFRQLNTENKRQTALLSQIHAECSQQTVLLRQLVAAPRGGARGRGRGRGLEGSVPALRSGRARDQEAAVSEAEAAAEDVEVPEQRGRPHNAQTRARAAQRSLSSPPHPPKRYRRQ